VSGDVTIAPWVQMHRCALAGNQQPMLWCCVDTGAVCMLHAVYTLRLYVASCVQAREHAARLAGLYCLCLSKHRPQQAACCLTFGQQQCT
jgi:hypothetical protein